MLTLKSFLSRGFQSEYKHGFILIFSSKILIAVLTFLTTPVLARVYRPSDYGLFALMGSLTAGVSLLTNLTLPTAVLVIEEKDVRPTIAGIIGYSVCSHLVVLLLLLAWIFFCQPTLPFGLYAIWMVCIASFLTTLTHILANLNIREKAFSKNVTVNLIDNVSIRLSSLSLGFLGFTRFGLFQAELLGKLANLAAQLRLKKSTGEWPEKRLLFSISNIRATFSLHKHYVWYNFPVALVNTFSSQLVLWMLALAFSSESLGHFTMALGLLNIPLLLFANSFQPLVTRKMAEQTIFTFRDFLGIASKISLISFSVYVIIFLAAPLFVGVYLGQTWLGTIEFVQILCVPFSLQLLGNSVGGAFIVFGKQRGNFVIKLILFTILVIGLYYQYISDCSLHEMVVFYAVVVSMEELTKICYLSLRLRNVRNS